MSTHTPVDVVQRQLDAYNTRDIEAYLATFADDAELLDLGTSTPWAIGKAEIRPRYAALFANSPALYSRLVSRVAFEQVVVDLEHITGRNGAAEPFEIMAIYEVREGLIHRGHFVRREHTTPPPAA